MTKVVVHDGKAHQDDFLASCVCHYKLDNSEVFRGQPSEQDFLDSDCWILDQGRRYEPELHNFDHHQIEQEICAFTMVLDYFYGKEYRKYLPQLRFVEIFDSYGPKKAAEFAGIPQDNLDIIASPLNHAMMRLFSKIEGKVTDPILPVMKEIGKEICLQIEDMQNLLKSLEDSVYFEYKKIKILDTTKCITPAGTKHDQLPTKTFCKIKNIEPDIVLTIDSRQEGYRMVSINTDVIKFNSTEKAYFTHNSGFLVGFKEYSDYNFILDNSVLHESKI